MNQPAISIIVPILNEEKYIRQCLENLLEQTYPAHLVTILLVDGQSKDQTRAVIQKVQNTYSERNIHLLDNPKGGVAAALNIGIQASKTDIILRMDAHSIPSPDFITVSVNALQESGAAFAGGIMQPVGRSSFSQALAEAYSHPLGSGGAKYRNALTGQFTDTAYLGALTKSIFEKAGLFNEGLICNEDYEMNIRIRKAGGKIYLDPRIRTQYTPRDTLKKLWDQYFRYGWWKVETLKLHPDSLQLRQLVPFLFVLSITASALISFWWQPAHYMLVIVLATYLTMLGFFTWQLKQQGKPWSVVLQFPIVIATMHIAWGSGFLLNVLSASTYPFKSTVKTVTP
ncbi:MAG: glycosyltransferase family 2 protein [Trueperaceae bacterium]